MTPKQDNTRYLIEQFLHDSWIAHHDAPLQDIVHKCADLIASDSTVDQALDTLPVDTKDERIMVEHLRPFLYIVQLRMASITAGGKVSDEDA
ncbi:MAG TPA: hypothetical protein VGL94_17685 [Ktedonobacteraceae bacterium]|jgi:hypothetical protein